jgi:hypothetical protein
VIPPATLAGLRKMCEAQIKAAHDDIQTPGQELIRGDNTEYKRGGIAALEGVVHIIKEMEKADGK